MPKRKRNKAYYKNSVKKRKFGGPQALTAGVKGILITSGDQGKFCVPEAYNLLNEYADQLYGPEAGASDQTPSGSEEEEEEEGGVGAASVDVSRSLEEEVAKLKRLKTENKRRFSSMDTGVKHLVFIRCSEEVDPTQLVHAILSDAYETNVKKSRFCQRILPVVAVCRANLTDICEKAEAMLMPYFHDNYIDVHTYCVQYKSRNSNLLQRDVVTRMVADLVTQEDEYPHRVDFDKPEYVVDVNVICNLCCLGVLRDFHKFRKYNIQTLTDPPSISALPPEQTPDTGKGSSTLPASTHSADLSPTQATDSLSVQAPHSTPTPEETSSSPSPPSQEQHSPDLPSTLCYFSAEETTSATQCPAQPSNSDTGGSVQFSEQEASDNQCSGSAPAELSASAASNTTPTVQTPTSNASSDPAESPTLSARTGGSGISSTEIDLYVTEFDQL